MRVVWIAAMLALIAGCETYAETVSCGMGLVLDENDECVPPPAPDGGTSIATCAELCDVVPGWTDAQRACLEEAFAMFGTLPPSCVGITTTEQCLACIGDAGAVDSACAGAPALCPP